ncbi:unnamed protein product [Cunninghamella blakesleeana]
MLTLSVNKTGEYHATFEGHNGKHDITVNIFEPPLIYFVIENVKKNSYWQIKGDQIIHIDSIERYTMTTFTITCKSISSAPYLDNNGNWATQNFIAPPSPSPLSSIMTPLINSIFTTSSSSPSETMGSVILPSTTSSVSFNHYDKEVHLTGVSRDEISINFDRGFLCIIYYFIMDMSHPLHNDIIIDWECEGTSKNIIKEKLTHFQDPSHYSYVSKEALANIHNQFSTFSSSKNQSNNHTLSSSTSRNPTTVDGNQHKEQLQKRKYSEIVGSSDEKSNVSHQESTSCKSQKYHH